MTVEAGTFLGANVAHVLHTAGPVVEGVQDAVRVPWEGMCEQVLKRPLFTGDPCCAVQHHANQHGPVQQQEVVPVPDYQRHE